MPFWNEESGLVSGLRAGPGRVEDPLPRRLCSVFGQGATSVFKYQGPAFFLCFLSRVVMSRVLYIKAAGLSGLWWGFEVCFSWPSGHTSVRCLLQRFPPCFADGQERHFGLHHTTKSCFLERLLSLCQARQGGLTGGIQKGGLFLGSPSVTWVCFRRSSSYLPSPRTFLRPRHSRTYAWPL